MNTPCSSRAENAWAPTRFCPPPAPAAWARSIARATPAFDPGRLRLAGEPFPVAGRWQISTAGGVEPSWNPNGKELVYVQGDKLMAVDVKTDTDRFEPGTPKVLFEAPLGNALRNAYVVAPDGQKFLVNTRYQSTNMLPMTVVLNWPASVRR